MPRTVKPRTSNRGGAPEAQRERAAATRAALVATARALFGEAGYHATGTTEIVARSTFTRGALYHHFADKEDLFAEVFREVLAELVAKTNASVADMSGDLWPQVCAAFRQYLNRIANEPEYQRILLIDGPAVLGWLRWRALMSEFVATGTADALDMMMNEGLVARQPPMPLAHLLQAALNDAALDIANSQSPVETEQAVSAAFLSLLAGLLTRG
ncbi:TetR/AcrR family transcriptional regulator [Novosphingobium malaysiense]|uniref:TetR/AcrR family transcriptional regulator n=1 Tax=Novosphingobium malaysiense TaxID=1348853 RepID=UPI000690D483|nr:TetR/AcrR family transcriptional regulator [Novosphingobium malaysiense]